MRFSVKSTVSAAVSVLALAGALAACGSAPASQSAPASSTSSGNSSAAAASVLTTGHFTGAVGVRSPAGASSAAYGFNGNAEELAVVYTTSAGAVSAVASYQAQADSEGLSDLVVTADVQAGPTVVTVTGSGVEMSQLVSRLR
jgi:hypothetical protein